MARILGLDLGSRSVKALVIESTFRGFAVRSFAEAAVDPDAGGLKAALQSLAAQRQLVADQIVVAPPGASVITHGLTLPFTDPKRVEATLPFEVESLLPFDLGEAVFDHQILGARDGKSEVLVGVIRKQELSDLLALLKELGVDPRVVTLPSLAYQGLFAAGLFGPAEGASGSEAVLDIGHERASLFVGTRQGAVELARTFASGGADLTRAIANEFKVSAADAQAFKESDGTLSPAEGAPAEVERAAATMRRALQPLVREVRQSLRARSSRIKDPVACLHLGGGGAGLKGLGELLSRELGLEVRPLAALPAEFSSLLPPGTSPEAAIDSQRKAAQAFALALRGHGTSARARFNLRQGALAFKGDFEYLKGKLSRLGAFAAILLLLAGVNAWVRLHTLGKQEAAIDGALCEATKRVLGTCEKDFLIAVSKLKGKESPAAAIPSYSAADLLAELTSRTPADTDLRYEEIEVSLGRIRLKGTVATYDAVDKLVAALKGSKCFGEERKKVDKIKDPTKGERVQFGLDLQVTCGEGALAPQG